MGVYVFNAGVLEERLLTLSQEHKDLDFGKHLIPSLIDTGTVFAYPFEGYWVDVGTIDAYWQTSMELVTGQSQLDLYDPGWVVHTRSQERAPVKVGPQATIHESMVCNGCVVRGEVTRSVLSPGVHVSPGAVVRHSVIMNDSWIGPGAVVDHCILDRFVVVGAGAQVGHGDDFDTPNQAWPDRFYTGITVAGISARIPGGTVIGRNVIVEPDVDEDAFASFNGQVPSGSNVICPGNVVTGRSANV